MEGQKTSVDFKLTMEFTGAYPEERVKELMYKVADALYAEYSHGNGFAPDEVDDCMTDGVRLKFDNIHLVDMYYVNNDGKTGVRKTNILDFPE